jgi:hypothetical protein
MDQSKVLNGLFELSLTVLFERLRRVENYFEELERRISRKLFLSFLEGLRPLNSRRFWP